ncbi:MAG: FAD:protein FMN transferase, partial [Bacillota bacterium]
MKNKDKRYSILILLVLLVLILSACGKEEVDISDIPQKTKTSFLMNTIVTMRVYAEKSDDVIDKSFNRLQEI